MRTSPASALIVLLLCSVGAAQTRAVIRGQTSAQAGELVILDAGASDADSFAWVMLSPPGHAYVTTDGGRRIAFATKCQAASYVVVLLAIQLDAEGKPSVDTTTHTVSVGGPTPPAPDPPSPPPGPQPIEPDLPEGQFGLAQFAYDAATELDPGARSKAAALGANFEAVASAAAAGAYRGNEREKIDAANNDLAGRNRTLLAGDENWQAWFVALQGEMRRLWDEGRLPTLDAHVIAFREISLGLKSVK